MVLFIIIIAVVIAVGISISCYINAKSSIKKRNGIIIMALAGACAFFLMLFWEIFSNFAVFLLFSAAIAVLLVVVYFFLQFITNKKYSQAIPEAGAETGVPAGKLFMPKKKRGRIEDVYGYTVQEFLDMTLEKVSLDGEPAGETVVSEHIAQRSKSNSKASRTHKKHPRRYVYQKQKMVNKPHLEPLKTGSRPDEETVEMPFALAEDQLKSFEPVDTGAGQSASVPSEVVFLPEDEEDRILEQAGETAQTGGEPAEDVYQESVESDMGTRPETGEDEENQVPEQAGEIIQTSGELAEDMYQESVGFETDTQFVPDEVVFLPEDEEDRILEQAGETAQTGGALTEDVYQESEPDTGTQGQADEPDEIEMPFLAFIEASVKGSIEPVPDSQTADEQAGTEEAAGPGDLYEADGQEDEESGGELPGGEDTPEETDRRQEAILDKAEMFRSQGRYLLAYHLYQDCLQSAEQVSEIKELKFRMLDCLVSAGQNEDASKLVFDILSGKYELTPNDKQQLKAYMTLFN